MLYLILKVLITSALIVGSSELAKRSTTAGASLISLPIASILALSWLYLDTRNTEAVRSLSLSIFWLVLPSLAFFVALAALLQRGMPYVGALSVSCLLTAVTYWGYSKLLAFAGVQL